MSEVTATATTREGHDPQGAPSRPGQSSSWQGARRPPPVLAQCGLTPADLAPLGPDARLAANALLTVERGEGGAVVGHQWVRDLQPSRGSSGRWSRRGDHRGLFAVTILGSPLTGPLGWVPCPIGQKGPPLLLVNGATEAIAAATLLRPRGRALVIAAPAGQWTIEAQAGLRSLAQAHRFAVVLLGFPETARGAALAAEALQVLEGALWIPPAVREVQPPCSSGGAPSPSWSAALRRLRGLEAAP